MFAAEIGRLAGVRIPLVPMSHQYLVTEAFLPRRERAVADAARPRPARLLPAGGRRPGDGRLRARPRAVHGDARRRTTRSRPDFNGRLLHGGLAAVRGDRDQRRSRGCRRWRTSGCAGSSTAPRRSPRTTSSAWARPRSPGFFVAAGFCAHGIAGAGGIGKVMAEWIVDGRADASTSGTWTSTGSAGSSARRATPWPARSRATSATTTSPIPGLQRPAGRPLRTSRRPTTGTASTARSSARSPAGSGSTTTDSNVARGRRVAAPATAGPGAVLVARDRRRAPRHPDDCGAVRRDVVRQDRGQRPGRRDLLEWVCDNRVARGDRRRHLHPGAQPPRRHRGRLHRHPDRRRRVPDRHRHGVRDPRHGLAAQAGPAPRRRRADRRRHRAATAATRCGGRGARDILGTLDRRPI